VDSTDQSDGYLDPVHIWWLGIAVKEIFANHWEHLGQGYWWYE
jgi:hypothetical protein